MACRARSCEPPLRSAWSRAQLAGCVRLESAHSDASVVCRYSCVDNDVRQHMVTDDALQAAPPWSREYSGLKALEAVTSMCVARMMEE
jgi:hypothetical protein